MEHLLPTLLSLQSWIIQGSRPYKQSFLQRCSVTTSSAGSYTCSASNGQTTSNAITQLSVIGELKCALRYANLASKAKSNNNNEAGSLWFPLPWMCYGMYNPVQLTSAFRSTLKVMSSLDFCFSP